jgi:hypothetical protein
LVANAVGWAPLLKLVECRVARWYILKPKIPFWVNFEEKMLVDYMVIWNILRPLVVLYGHLAMLWQFGMYIFPCFGSKLGQEKSGNPGRMQIGSDTRALDRFRNEMQFGN